jgi:hypothetical protein
MIESMIEDHLDATRARPSCGGAAPCEVGVEAAASGPSLVSAERIVRTRAA